MMLCSMMLADYLPLKVEIEGTSGAGSTQVKRLRSSLASLLEPLAAAALRHLGGAQSMRSDLGENAALMELYRRPGELPELTDYIKVDTPLPQFCI